MTSSSRAPQPCCVKHLLQADEPSLAKEHCSRLAAKVCEMMLECVPTCSLLWASVEPTPSLVMQFFQWLLLPLTTAFVMHRHG
eukprot:1458420-Amphidinium_carterae.1